MRQTVFVTIVLCALSLAHSRDFGFDSGSSCFCGIGNGRVCGNDGITYASQCRADCVGVGIACTGQCPCEKSPSGCGCNRRYDPVCGTDGVDYPNECLADCEGVKVDCKGKCPCQKPCVCTKEYAPVCSTNGQTYGNKCQAECDNAKIACEKECPCLSTGCTGPVARCAQDPCNGATCPAYPNAACKANYCGGCNKDFYLDGKIVDCKKPDDGCVCTALADPVCGVDGKMYGNPCNAGCAGVEIACKGECPCPEECDGTKVNCLRDPCDGATCDAHPDAICKPNYCNGCNAEFFKDGALVDCDVSDSECGKEDAGCDPRLAPYSWSSRNKDQCCPGFECCYCQPVQGPIAPAVEPRGTCKSRCIPCRG